ncbi:lmo0954 family membrane protein [Ornithinibacillus halophilus]|uniref:Lia operon protein LiaI n=1 Tax=Ornithinibacillus halophilus TaxID=930117 RepID=A0A1M5F614_9BACI|nr:flagellar basal body rod protein [Ornithinibacillus halophilus]SHF86917.1 lia operon protein LiaI [Ornithinibacillus halophilus]
MKKFLLFIVGLIALLVLLANLGPMVLLGVSVWLLYVIFKKFIKSDSVAGKIGWVFLGLIVVSIAFSNVFAVIGIAAAYILYVIYKGWKEDDEPVGPKPNGDPFDNFEKQWAEFNN